MAEDSRRVALEDDEAALLRSAFPSGSSITGAASSTDASSTDASSVGAWSIADSDITSNSGDSSLGDDIAESTASLRQSLYEGVTENGRSYHRYKEGKYVLPSDDRELDRLDLQHQLFLMTTNYKLNLAPISNGAERVLDVGCGTGLWAMDFAQEHPDTEVIGVDLSPSQPDFVPANCRFEIDDAEEPWTWSNKFDYIHARMMTSSFADWPRFFQQCFDNTKPGSYVEMQDTDFPLRCQDDTFSPDTKLYQWSEQIVSGLKVFGRELATTRYKQYMEDAGFVNVKEIEYVWPQNPWPRNPRLKELGRWNLVNSLDGLEGYSMALFTRAHGMSAEEVQVLMAGVRADMKNTKIHAYWPIYFVYGQKPLDAS